MTQQLQSSKNFKDSSVIVRKFIQENENLSTKEAFRLLKVAEDLLRKDSDKKLWAEFYLDAGEIYFHHLEIDKAIENYIKSYEFFELTNSPNKQLIESRFGNIYTQTGNFSQAEEYLFKAHNHALATNDKEQAAENEASIGWLYYMEYMEKDDSVKLESSLNYSKKAYKWIDQYGDDLSKMKLNVAIAQIISFTHNGSSTGDSAYYYYFQKAIKLADTSKTIPLQSKAFAYNQYARYLFDIGRPDLAEVNAEKAFEFVKNMESFEKLAIAKTLYKSYIENKKFEKAAQFFEKYSELQDSLRKFEKYSNIQTLIHQQENPRKDSWIEKHWEKVLIIMLAFFTIVFVFVKMNQKRKLKDAQNELNQLSHKVSTLNSDISKYEDEIIQLKNDSNANMIEMGEKEAQLKDILETPLLTDDQWLSFKQSFERVNNDYSKRIPQYFSNVSQAELRYLYLIKLGLNHKEIASVLGISSDSVRLYKHRLGKKVTPGKENVLSVLFNSN
ncbi:helix-turn-helix domain-containing protein [Moheibacter sediminis]|uniref:hypothetical protein n=1 Tax=Moheibacter sediminis TaxID=1434700 RepID=UPI00117F9D12|nr:hypothetical protein [Moheibacter sediminis]